MVKLPDFIIIGAGKAGTTSLHNYLKQHPQIYLCPKKETFYFTSQNYRSRHRKYGAIQNLQEYQALFKEASSESVVGEVSTTYYSHAESAQLIHQTLPNVKILGILRNPIERAFSAYQMHVNNGSETRDFSEVIDPGIKYVSNGFYYSQLKLYYKTFSKSQIQISLYDDYCKDIGTFLKEIFTFIDVEPDFTPDTSKRRRIGGVPRQRWVRKLLAEENLVRATAATILKTVMPLETRQQIRQYLLQRNIVRTSLDRENYLKLAEIYRDDILKLQDILDRDLSQWLSLQ